MLKFYDSYTQYLFPLEIRYLIAPQVQTRPAADGEAISSSNKLHLGFSGGTVLKKRSTEERRRAWWRRTRTGTGSQGLGVDVMQLSQA